MATPTTVTIAVSIELTMLSRNPESTSVARVRSSVNCTTITGTITQRRLRKQTIITPPSSKVEAQPNRRPSSSMYWKPSVIITGSPAIIPDGSLPTIFRSSSIVSRRGAASGSDSGSNRQTTAAIRPSALCV